MLEKIVTAIVGSKHERDLKKLIPLLHKINEKEAWAMSLKEKEFPRITEEFKNRIKKGETTDSILPEAFAVAREAARRTLGERPYDVQLIGAVVLHQGKIMEMKAVNEINAEVGDRVVIAIDSIILLKSSFLV